MNLSAAFALAVSLAAYPAVAQTPPAPYAYTELAATPFSMGTTTQFGALTYAGGLFLTSPGGRLGGVSGLEARTGNPGEVRFAAITDYGDFAMFTGKLDESGKLKGAGDLAITSLRDENGQTMVGKVAGDAEDLSALPNGTGWLVTFEQRHRATLHTDPFGPKGTVSRVNIPGDAKTLSPNQGLEAVAALADGRILYGAESGRMWICPPTENPCPQVHGPGGMGFLMMLTSLDTLEGDDLVATYRRPRPLGGFDVSIVQVSLTAKGAVLKPLAELPSFVGNVEGITAVRAEGGWRLYVVTDNGGSDAFPTRLLAFDWKL